MGTPAVIQFCEPDGTICARLYAHYDGKLIPERLGEFERMVKLRGWPMGDSPSKWAAGYSAWQFDYHRAEYGVDLFEALSHIPHPEMRDCNAVVYWRVFVSAGKLCIVKIRGE